MLTYRLFYGPAQKQALKFFFDKGSVICAGKTKAYCQNGSRTHTAAKQAARSGKHGIPDIFTKAIVSYY